MGTKNLPIKAKSPGKTEAINADRALPIHLKKVSDRPASKSSLNLAILKPRAKTARFGSLNWTNLSCRKRSEATLATPAVPSQIVSR